MKNTTAQDDFLDFLNHNPQYAKLLTTANLLHSRDLNQYIQSKVLNSFQTYQESRSKFHVDLPLEYVLGDTIVGCFYENPQTLVKMDFNSLSGSILFCGATGSGKTNALLFLLHQIRDKYFNEYTRFLVIASKYQCEQRSLLLNAQQGSVYFLDKSIFAFNPLNEFRNYKRNLVIADTARCLACELGIFEAGQLYLASSLNSFLEKFTDGNLVEFVDWLSRKKETSKDYLGYRDRLLVRLIPMMNEIGSIFDFTVGLNQEFITENLIIELPCSSTFVTASVATLIMMRMYRIKNMHPEFQRYRNILVFEDIYDAIMRSDSRKQS